MAALAPFDERYDSSSIVSEGIRYMYNTPNGNRILLGAERRFFTHSLAMVVDLLATGDIEFGITSFDELQWNQKLVVLYKSGRGLLRPDEPPPKLTAFIESAVAVVYEFVKDQVEQEIDDPESGSEPSHWRQIILDAAREQNPSDELPNETHDDAEAWSELIQCLAEHVLWDSDYQLQGSMDLPPEESQQLRDTLGMPDDYFMDIPDEPPENQRNLYVDALMGLTADAR